MTRVRRPARRRRIQDIRGNNDDCWICGNELRADEYMYHAACEAERERRLREYACVRCGGEPAAAGSTKCRTCGSMARPPYVGYPEAP